MEGENEYWIYRIPDAQRRITGINDGCAYAVDRYGGRPDCFHISGNYFHTGTDSYLCAQDCRNTWRADGFWPLDPQLHGSIYFTAHGPDRGYERLGGIVPEFSVADFQLFLLVLFRVGAMLQVAPLFSSSAIPPMARIGFSFFIALAIFPWIRDAGYYIPESFVEYFLLVVGEALIGVLIGFYLVIIFAAFQVAGQFFSLQMGLGASQVFDPLAQIQIPLMGQFLNIIAMFVFLTINGFHKFMISGVLRSFQAFKAVDLVLKREQLFEVIITSLGQLFEHALVIAFPILGTLLLVSVTMGLLAKAAPQMNLLMIGFPIAIATAYIVLIVAMPFLIAAFARIIDGSFSTLEKIYLYSGVGK